MQGVERLFPIGVFDNGRPGRGGLAMGWELLSGKMAVAARMLHVLHTETDDRCEDACPAACVAADGEQCAVIAAATVCRLLGVLALASHFVPSQNLASYRIFRTSPPLLH